MPAAPLQPDPKEAVEARLCAYLEGDLTAAEQAGIERHLDEHPQHRQLLADLARGRQWLREVPAEPAPADVAEAFQQQVERSLLLGEGTAPRRPGGRWPQRVLVAALVLLTLGLGVVLTLVLAPPRGSPGRVAVVPSKPSPRPATKALPLPAAAADAARAAAPPSVQAAVAQNATAVEAQPAPAVTESGPTPGPPAIHLRVATADPAAVARFLTRSGFHREPAVGGGGGGVETASAAGPGQYAVAGMTPAQVRQFTADLTAAAAPGRVTTDPAAPPAQAVAPGDRLNVVIPQLTGAGLEQANAVRVADDGTIALPMVDPVQVAGATPAEVARRVGDRYRQSNLIANATVAVTPLPRPAAVPGAAPGATVIVDVQAR